MTTSRSMARHRDLPVRSWLNAGAVTIGIGAAVVTGSGPALADTGTETGTTKSTSTESTGNEGAAQDKAGPGDVTSDDGQPTTKPEPTTKPARPNTHHPSVTTEQKRTTTTRKVQRPSAKPQAVSSRSESRDTASASTTDDPGQPNVGSPRSVTVPVNPAIDNSPATPLPAAKASPQPTITTPSTWRSVASSLLRRLGLTNLTANGIPAAPLPPPVEALWLLVRRNPSTAQRGPTITRSQVDEQDASTGVITGTVAADGDDVSFRASQPSTGLVTVDQRGQWSYIPNDATAKEGGQATFTITATDRFSASATQAVQLAVAPVSAAAAAAAPLDGYVQSVTYNAKKTRAYLITQVIDNREGRVVRSTALSIIDTATGRTISTNPVTLDGDLVSLTFTPDGKRALLQTTGQPGRNIPLLSIINTATNTALGQGFMALTSTLQADPIITNTYATILTTFTPPTGQKPTTTLSTIRLSDGSVTASTPLTGTVHSLEYNAKKTRAYLITQVIDNREGRVVRSTALSIIDTATGKTISTNPVTLDGDLVSLTFTPDGKRALLQTTGQPGRNIPLLSIINTATNTALGQGFMALTSTLQADPIITNTYATILTTFTPPTGQKPTTTLSTIRLSDGSVTASTPLTGTVHSLEYNAKKTRAYLITQVIDNREGRVVRSTALSIIDTATGRTISTNPVTLDGDLVSLTFTPDGKRALLQTTGQPGRNIPLLSIINTATNTALGQGFMALTSTLQADPIITNTYATILTTFTPPTGQKPVTTLSTIRLSDGSVTATTPLDGYVHQLTYNAKKTRAYLITQTNKPGQEAPASASTSLTIINTATGRAISQIPATIAGNLVSLTFTPDGKRALLQTNGRSGPRLAVINTATNTALGQGFMALTSTLQADPIITNTYATILTTFAPATGQKPVTTLSTIRLSDGSVTATTPLDGYVHQLTYNAKKTRAYLITQVRDTARGGFQSTALTIINTANGRPISQNPVVLVGGLESLTFTPDGKRALMQTNGRSGPLLSVINTATNTALGQGFTALTSELQAPPILTNTYATIITTFAPPTGQKPITYISAIRLSDGAFTASAQAVGTVYSVTFNANRSKAYLITEYSVPTAGAGLTALTIINTANGKTHSQNPVVIDGDLIGLHLTPDGKHALLHTTSRSGQLLAVIDTATNTVVGQVMGLAGNLDANPILTNTYATLPITRTDPTGGLHAVTTTLTTIRLSNGTITV